MPEVRDWVAAGEPRGPGRERGVGARPQLRQLVGQARRSSTRTGERRLTGLAERVGSSDAVVTSEPGGRRDSRRPPTARTRRRRATSCCAHRRGARRARSASGTGWCTAAAEFTASVRRRRRTLARPARAHRPRAAAHAGQPRRHRGRARRAARPAPRSRSSTPRSTRRCRRSPTATPCPTDGTTSTASAATASTAPATATSARAPPSCWTARWRPAAGHPAPGQRLQRGRRPRRRVGRHDDGPDPARGPGDGHPQRRRRPGRCSATSPSVSTSTCAGVIDALNTRSGLLGLSGVSNDMRTRLPGGRRGSERPGSRSTCSATARRSTVGALAVALGGLDALVFTGGIGEHDRGTPQVLAPPRRARPRRGPRANADHGRHTGGRVSHPGRRARRSSCPPTRSSSSPATPRSWPDDAAPCSSCPPVTASA